MLILLDTKIKNYPSHDPYFKLEEMPLNYNENLD